MMLIHDDEVNKIAECNLLHAIISLHRLTKILNSHYSRILLMLKARGGNRECRARA